MVQRRRPIADRPVFAGVAVIAFVAIVALELWLAPKRALSADEALYLCAALPPHTQWPLGDHPPLLGAMLATAHGLAPRSIELAVRVVSIALTAVTAVAIALLAARDSTEKRRAFAIGLTLGSIGVTPLASALLTTPDGPMLAAMAVFFALDRDGPPTRARAFTRIGFGVLACFAKVTAVVALAAIALEALRRKRWDRATVPLTVLAIALFFGAIRASIVAQIAHVVGVGPRVSAPHVGAIAALAALVVGQVALWGPMVVWTARARRASIGEPTRERAVVALTVGAAAIVSAVASGRPPEPSWLALVGLWLFPRVAAILAESTTPRRRAFVIASAVAPVPLLVSLWLGRLPLPASTPDLLARLPRPPMSTPIDAATIDAWVAATRTQQPTLPWYVPLSWRCAYGAPIDLSAAIPERSSITTR